MTDYHIPVLLEASLEGLNIKPEGTYVDVTFGGGGHSRAILERLSDKGRLIAFDRDADALANAPEDPRFTLVNHDFMYLKNFLKYLNAIPVEGVLADLGLSSHHVDTPERGFSFRFDGPLDMRMDQGMVLTAADIVNNWEEKELHRIFGMYGEIKNARTLANELVSERKRKPIATTTQFTQAIDAVIPRKENKKKYLAQVFQALRIAVNDELRGLELFLNQTPAVIGKSGRLVVITYHSLEDRLVKNFILQGKPSGSATKDIYGNVEKPFQQISNKPLIPTEQEILYNPRARSAKLRIAERI